MASPDELRMEAWRVLLRAHAGLLETMGREMEAERDLPLTWYEVLLHLGGANGRRIRMSELAGCVLLSRSGLTRVVDRMVEAGLVSRESCPTDRRGSFAALTPAGRARLRAAAPVHLRGIRDHFGSQLSDEEAEVLLTALGRVLSSLGQHLPDGEACAPA
jgi:DNA-binding MarR family transcriptional regulator